MGIPGPCGPDSEIFIDRGDAYGPEGDIEKAGDRYLEFWNLVFMQNLRGQGIGKDDFEILGELPAKNIDTGMGLERMAMLLQGKDSIYEIDEVSPVLERAAELGGKTYRANHERRRPAPRGRRPRAQRADADLRRGDARQRVPRLRPAPDPAPGRPVDEAARRRRAHPSRAAAGVVPDDASLLSRAGQPVGPDPADRVCRGADVPPDAEIRDDDVRPGRGADPHGRRRPAVRCGRVRAARHVRLPDRPHAGDGRRAGACGRRGRLPSADGRAAGHVEGGRLGEEGPARRPQRLPAGARRVRSHRLAGLSDADHGVPGDRDAARGCGDSGAGRG